MSQVATPPDDRPVYPGERLMFELAHLVPGFGGLYLDSGRMVVYLKDTNRADDLQPYLEPILQRARDNGAVFSGAPVVTRQGDFSFLELRIWRDWLTNPVLSTAGVAFLDLDERRNRVVIGVYDEAANSTLENIIGGMPIPRQAVLLKPSGRIIQDAAPTLRDSISPLVGGIQNSWTTNPPVFPIPCTIGFNAIWQGSKVWVTNSHCTEHERAVTTSATYWQPAWVTGSWSIGVEAADQLGDLCDWWTKRCRRSDAAVIYYTGPPNEHRLGFIARPLGPAAYAGDGSTAWGQIEIDPNRDSFKIISDDEDPNILAGWFVEKVGRRSGWTSGNVVQTCVQTPHPCHYPHPDCPNTNNWWFKCQYTASYRRASGDSGAPVFSRVSGGEVASQEVRLFGIHWGNRGYPSGDTIAIFSPISGVKHDLGAMNIVAPPDGGTPPPAPRLSVTITPPLGSGDTRVRPFETCQYLASASSGSSPYTYNWYIDGVPAHTGQILSHASGTANFEVSVIVTDSANNTASHLLLMTPDYSAPECLDM